MNDEQTTSDEVLTYTYRPSQLGAAWEFRPRPAALEWQAGRHTHPGYRLSH